MTIMAQDPGVRDRDGKIVMASVDVPAENLGAGPRGHRVYVVDYDTSTEEMYAPVDYEMMVARHGEEPFRPRDDSEDPSDPTQKLVDDPEFHAMNVYAIVMRILARFEFALGRHVEWAIPGHQLKVAPHGFCDGNAFYSPPTEALMFGYFTDHQAGRTIYSCLSHDVIAHETTHALVDGLRDHFTDPSSPDQAAFHEGFADVVALLSVLAIPEVVRTLLGEGDAAPEAAGDGKADRGRVSAEEVEEGALQQSVLLKLAKEMGEALTGTRGNALRQSADLEPDPAYLHSDEFIEPHRRGEILAATMLRAFIKVWRERISRLKLFDDEYYDRGGVADEGAEAADFLLTLAIRALDYTPPVHLTFEDYRAALVTAYTELHSAEHKYDFRSRLEESFEEFGIGRPQFAADGMWDPAPEGLVYDRTRFEAMQTDRNELFRFVWENRDELELIEDAYTEITSIRPSVRVAPEDGFVLRETVVECIQMLSGTARELEDEFNVKIPDGMPEETELVLRGGATLVFDDFGRLKFRIPNLLPVRRHHQASGVPNRYATLNAERLEHLWQSGYYVEEFESGEAAIHSIEAAVDEAAETVEQSIEKAQVDIKQAVDEVALAAVAAPSPDEPEPGSAAEAQSTIQQAVTESAEQTEADMEKAVQDAASTVEKAIEQKRRFVPRSDWGQRFRDLHLRRALREKSDSREVW